MMGHARRYCQSSGKRSAECRHRNPLRLGVSAEDLGYTGRAPL